MSKYDKDFKRAKRISDKIIEKKAIPTEEEYNLLWKCVTLYTKQAYIFLKKIKATGLIPEELWTTLGEEADGEGEKEDIEQRELEKIWELRGYKDSP